MSLKTNELKNIYTFILTANIKAFIRQQHLKTNKLYLRWINVHWKMWLNKETFCRLNSWRLVSIFWGNWRLLCEQLINTSKSSLVSTFTLSLNLNPVKICDFWLLKFLLPSPGSQESHKIIFIINIKYIKTIFPGHVAFWLKFINRLL